MDDPLFLHALLKIPGIGTEKIRKLLNFFGSAEAAWKGSRASFVAAGLSEKLADAIVAERLRISPQNEAETLKEHGIRLISRRDEDYPLLLGEIPNPPELLYFRGNIHPNSTPLLTIVGTRKPSEYGSGIAREFAKELSKIGIGVVSGLALGIDQECHKGALEGGGATIAVLGNGLDDASIAPRAHAELARAIARQGALLSDYPPGTPASEFTFPARNRIMAGISLGTIVIEASEKSGTLITARLATEYNREVFAVPGSIYSEGARGPHALIRSGATLVANLSDILDSLPLLEERDRARNPENENRYDTETFSPDEARLLKTLGSDTMHIDALVKHSGIGASSALSAISFLEMKGCVKNVGNMHYIRVYRRGSV